MLAGVTVRQFSVLDSAPLRRGKIAVLELDAPSPLLGLTVGAPLTVVFRDGTRETVTLTSIGFASSTPDHAHIVISMPSGRIDEVAHVELPVMDATPALHRAAR